jgi:regulation of enolase protein 1 (concanavalin A-like superfamily)
MLQRSCWLLVILLSAAETTASAAYDDREARTNEIPGWGRVFDPSRDCDVSLDRDLDRLKVKVPGTPHVLSAEVPGLPMNAPRVVRRVRGDFTASVRVLGRLEPGRSRTTLYDPFHGAGLIVWQDPSNYLRLERAVGYIDGRPCPYINYELREGGRLAVSHGIETRTGSFYLMLGRRGRTFSARYSRDGRRWFELARLVADLDERVEVGVVAVKSSGRTMWAELEWFRLDDPQGSMARDYADDDAGKSSPAPPASEAIVKAPSGSR